MKIEEMWDLLLKAGVNEQVLVVVTDINGYNEQSMLDIYMQLMAIMILMI